MTRSVLEMCESTKGCFRCSSIVVNSCLLLLGAVSLATGIWLLAADDSFFRRYRDVIADSDVNDELLKGGVIVLLGGGVAILMLASLGVVAAFTTNSCLLALYSVLLAVLMVVEIVPVILAVVFKSDWVSKIDQEALYALHNKYGGQFSPLAREFTAAFDALQADFECCGWHNGSDYVTAGVKPLRWHTTTDDGAVLVVPWSCCPTHNETLRNHCVTEPTSSDIYVTSGCRDALTSMLTTHQLLLIGLGAATLGLELLMVLASITLLFLTVNNKYTLS